MYESDEPAEPTGSALEFVAFRYACEDLSPDDAASFEERLAWDQGARDALCRGIQTAGSLSGSVPQGPDRSYRNRVRKRLLQGRQVVHPVVWAFLGAAAAVLAMLSFGYQRSDDARSGLANRGREAPSVASAKPAGPAEVPPIVVANVWADLHTPDHLARVHDEEARRRSRQDDLHLPSGADERRRSPTNPTTRH